ncbi:hypothetical protein GCM10025791_42580 [Halioxenophilus aromaticivorans]|uniref:Chromosomal replication initiator protein DnaA n=1 Tax=Halioxenophilus aromaticivorans TaxID=1306992 RepID=A0AAV3U8T7_9ALTE
MDWVNNKYLTRIERLVSEYNQGQVQSIGISVRPKQSLAGRQQRSVSRPLNVGASSAQPGAGGFGSSPNNAFLSTNGNNSGGRNNNRSAPVSAAQLLAGDHSANSSPMPNANRFEITGGELTNRTSSGGDDDWADFDWSEVQGAGDSPSKNNQGPSAAAQSVHSTNTLNSAAPPVRSLGGMGYGAGADLGSSRRETPRAQVEGAINHAGGLNTTFTFKSFVEGKSNQLGLAAAQQVAENPGGAYNPLFIYGGVGLGKTHLMHAVGNAIQNRNPNAKVIYLHSERFVADMVKALQLNAINDFKRYYRSVDALLIDDIQFFSGKERSQEEFFHTFNALLEGGQQIILTCDRYPKEIKNVEERLKSRFGWGLTVAVEPPELETRVAILMKKAVSVNMDLPNEAAFFIAQRVRSNVRELEGALKRVIAHSHFTRRPIDVPLVTEALKDLLALQSKQVSIDNIQRVVAEYYKIKVSDLHSKRRSRSVARPRQVAMALAKELTNHSLPEIGEAFGGRDHTTVLHACRKIKELKEIDGEMQTDVKNLMRLLTT